VGHKELIASIQKDARDRISAIRNEAESEMDKIRKELSAKIDRLREEHGKLQEESMKILEERAESGRERLIRGIRLSAEKSAADRLFPLALSCLQELRDEQYKDTFHSLAEELPSLQWNQVRVNDKDRDAARACFPESPIQGDNSITGGMVVALDGMKISISNTFEKRLARAWEEILPPIMRDVYKEVSNNEHSD
jgi:vacuolar-type H+-ATPase subunit E/Vma4